ncbi:MULTISPECIES: branched-chain amino acid ABC transporter permease [Bacillales]|jgi:branched-chain amino acid transport system permease protein|uniref:High-affinity branched-chain amino acid transport system permease protein LivH n=1 Tax=Peribacillus simplex TaxID=1478 RepID=A0A9W4PIF4_9BACI|nr:MULTISPECIES: branched-chain amino acid ABC transporter permease [Bacillales]MBT2672938.1 branched-chain amino acid ABC transporter permease [Streptomyces sp. ISL-14]MBO0996408.1 branched-chain amino acid ABC transporter permease [Bacillus sp. SD075]MBT2667523.1 branched-chain amino acid ABC transporter permease [Bacillus sp. ISL-4]MCM3673389.1 branched-chain amino acid ABC transporter permease [Peribacillus simplex]MDM5211522.1 branched-chain amino acid ABC transporter permease [Peribacill
MELIQQLVNGISLGSIYALIALGYTMVYGIVKLINFAHGDVFMVGSFVGFYAITVMDLSFIPALLISMVTCAIFGVLIERIAYKPLRNATRIAALITAIGVSLLIENGLIYIRGAQPEAYPNNVLPMDKLDILGVSISSQSILILSVSIILMIILQFVVHKTKIGKAMRAVSFDSEAAKLMGINVNNTISATFAIGSALAGAAGVIFGIYYIKIEPLMGVLPGLKAFVAAVLGGIGIIPGAMVGGLLLGVIEALVSAAGYSLWRDGVAFVVLILILIFLPQGLFGKNKREKV